MGGESGMMKTEIRMFCTCMTSLDENMCLRSQCGLDGLQHLNLLI